MRGLSAIRTRSEPRSIRASTRLARTEILTLYPTLRKEDVAAVMAYAAEPARERIVLTNAA